MKDVNIELLMGLPGSGKTHYAKEHENHRNGTYAVILDELSDIRCYGKRKPMHELVQIGVGELYNRAKTIILDGPFFTNEQIRLALSAAAEEYGTIHVTIHHWEENREYCLKNDGGRREVPSTHTILNAEYEIPNTQWLNAQLAEQEVIITKVVTHDVELKPDWLRYWRAHLWHDDGKLHSESWCTGGCWKDCWGGSSPVSPEDPLPFKALDELLLEIAPQITFLQYKRIQDECVSSESTYDRDYYGGGVSRCHWVCNLEKLYEMLHQFGYATA